MQNTGESCVGVTPSHEQMTLDIYIGDALQEKRGIYGKIALEFCMSDKDRQQELAQPLQEAAMALAEVRCMYVERGAVELHLSA